MPVHNGARFLRLAIESVLAQTFRDFELLVVDDGSSDESVSIVRGFSDARVRSVAGHGRRGLVGTLNLGLQLATGQYVARLDHDDLAHADRLAKQVAWLDQKPSVALVGSLARLIDEQGRHVGTVRRPVSEIGIRWYSLIENPLIHSTVMFRLEVVRAIGGYDETLPLAEDYDLWTRLLQQHPVENLPDCLVDYRRSPASVMGRIEGGVDGDKRRQLHDIMTALIKRRVSGEFEEPACTDQQAALLATFTVGVEQRRWREFLALLTRLRVRFERKWGAATNAPDYWRTVAGQYDAIAFRMTPPSRLAAAGVYAQAWSAAPRAAAHVPWVRAMALIVLGKQGRRLAANSVTRATR
jgi:glycosyltransferase involved in cell wall biosynthesis